MSHNTSKDPRTSLHDNPRRLAIMLRSARHRTSQKKKNYLYYMEGTMGSICAPGEKINGTTQKLANVCDVVREGLRKNT